MNEYFTIEDPWSMLNDIIKKEGGTLEPRLIGEAGRNTLLACYRVGLYVDKKMVSSGKLPLKCKHVGFVSDKWCK